MCICPCGEAIADIDNQANRQDSTINQCEEGKVRYVAQLKNKYCSLLSARVAWVHEGRGMNQGCEENVTLENSVGVRSINFNET